MSQPNPSLRKKTAARVAAIQLVYETQMRERVPGLEVRITRLKDRLKENPAEQKLLVGEAIEPNYKLVEALLAGLDERREDVDKRLDSILDRGWSRERMGRLMVGLLQCAVYELLFYKEINFRIVIDEYTGIARRFFDEKDANFVHAALSTLAQRHG